MPIAPFAGRVLGLAAATALLAACSGIETQSSPPARNASRTQSNMLPKGAPPRALVPSLPSRRLGPSSGVKAFMRRSSAGMRLTYISDVGNSAVAVFDRAGNNVGVITSGLEEPQGIVVDSIQAGRNLWVANTTGPGRTGEGNIVEFARGGTTPIKTLSDPNMYPDDVAVCPNGTVYASNLFAVDGSSSGSISVYAPGSTSPTGSLIYPGETEGYYLACDADNNIFTTMNVAGPSGDGPAVVEYVGGQQSGATRLPISGFVLPQGIKVNPAGNLVINDAWGHTIMEYTEAGVPTGSTIATGSGTLVDIAVTYNGRVVGGADAAQSIGSSWLFPSGAHRGTYSAYPFTEPVGFAFDPARI